MLPTRNNDTIMELDGRIEKFIGKHHVLTLATATEEGAGPDTRHARMLARNALTAASIVLETRVVGKVQGLQITGRTAPAAEGDKSLYLKKFPYAALADLNLWRMEAETMKLTDNTLGFGKKLIWQRQE